MRVQWQKLFLVWQTSVTQMTAVGATGSIGLGAHALAEEAQSAEVESLPQHPSVLANCVKHLTRVRLHHAIRNLARLKIVLMEPGEIGTSGRLVLQPAAVAFALVTAP